MGGAKRVVLIFRFFNPFFRSNLTISLFENLRSNGGTSLMAAIPNLTAMGRKQSKKGRNENLFLWRQNRVGS